MIMKEEQKQRIKHKLIDAASKRAQSNAVFSSEEMIAFGNFIRDNYYVAGLPKMLSYTPSKYPHAKVDEIFVYWCLENGR
jgi:hypothetical protein